jgi:hypothetical protein
MYRLAHCPGIGRRQSREMRLKYFGRSFHSYVQFGAFLYHRTHRISVSGLGINATCGRGFTGKAKVKSRSSLAPIARARRHQNRVPQTRRADGDVLQMQKLPLKAGSSAIVLRLRNNPAP